MATSVDHAKSDEFGMQDLTAELTLEICTYLEVHDQLAMRRVCKRWRLNLSGVLFSKYVDLDISKMLTPKLRLTAQNFDDWWRISKERLEYALNTHLQKNTKSLVIREGLFRSSQFGVVAKVIKNKAIDLIQLMLKDCKVQDSVYWWLPIYGLPRYRMHDLIYSVRRLILDNYTIWNVLGDVRCELYDMEMPCSIPVEARASVGHIHTSLPITVPRLEFDRSKRRSEHYHSFVSALNSNCPEVNSVVRDDVVELYNSWKYSNAQHIEWQTLGIFIKSLHEGVIVTREEVDVTALQELDPLTLNKLAIEALHRIYCLPHPLPVYKMYFH